MRKLLLLLALIGAFCHASYAQNSGKGAIEGTVKTSDGRPAQYINISISGTGKGAVTDQEGHFSLKNITPGNHRLKVSFVGLESKEITVTIRANEVVTLPDIELNESSQQLQEVVVQGQATKKNTFARKKTEYVARLPIDNLENPQVYNVITNELMKEQQVTDMQSALQNAPGINNIAEGVGSGGVGLNVTMRGFSTSTAMRNGMATTFVTPTDPVNLDRIEVIKGPSATLFGSTLTSYGGLINRVTKKPFKEFKGEVSFSGGSFGLGRLAVDLNTPLNQEKTALFRINAVNHRENSFLNQGRTHTWAITPNFTYKVNDRLTFNIESEILNTSRPSVFFGVRNTTTDNLSGLQYDFEESFITDELQSEVAVFNVYAQANYQLSPNWTSQTNYSYANTDNHANYMFLNFISDSEVQRMPMQIPSNFNSFQLQQNFIGNFQLGPLKNRLLVGLDYYHLTTSDRRTRFVYDTVSYGQASVDFSIEKYNATLAQTNPFFIHSRLSDTYSAYASDVINISRQLIAMLSLRVDHFSSKDEDYQQTALSPKLGLVYQVYQDRVSLFANYMDGFSNVAPDGTGTDEQTFFKPEHATQLEGGIKLEMFKGKLNGTLSYYDITVRDVVRSINTGEAGTFSSVQDGTQKSKGFEADIIANPIAGLNIVAGYGYNDSKYTKAAEAVQGKRPYSTPEHSANLWLSYKLMQPQLNGLGLGLGGNYESDSYYDDANTFTIPGHTVLNASIFYEQPTFRLGLKVNNFTDEQYWSGRFWVLPQKTRNFVATAAYRF